MEKIVLLCTALVAVTHAKQFGVPQENTNGFCVFNNKNYKPGEEWFSSDCKKWKCVKGSDENKMIMEGESCDYDRTKGRDCEAKIIDGKNYPECCSTEVVCGRDRPTRISFRVERAAGGYDRYASEGERRKEALDRLHRVEAQYANAPVAATGGYRPNSAGVDEAFANVDRAYADVMAARDRANQFYGNTPDRNRDRDHRRRYDSRY